MFITSTEHIGNLAGLLGADTICVNLATAAGLVGTYKAWLFDGTTSAANRLTQSPWPYVLVNGTKVADTWADLTDGTLDHAIDLDETGAVVAVSEVWTGTHTDGTKTGADCTSWRAPVFLTRERSGCRTTLTLIGRRQFARRAIAPKCGSIVSSNSAGMLGVGCSISHALGGSGA